MDWATLYFSCTLVAIISWFFVIRHQSLADKFKNSISIENEAKRLNKAKEIKEFDFIVVGAGSAGCVIAEGLSQSGKYSVFLVEAGSSSSSSASMSSPSQWPSLLRSCNDWSLRTTPQKGLANRQVEIAQGKGFGGSSAINAMMWMRGRDSVYDGWNIPGWAAKDLAPHFDKIEAVLKPTSPQSSSELMFDFCQSAAQLGHRFSNSDASSSVSPSGTYSATKFSINGGSGARNSAYNAFIEPNLDRPNLSIISGFEVEKVLINPNTWKASGITGSYNSEDNIPFHARKEVIVATGAIHSPQLVYRSLSFTDTFHGSALPLLIQNMRSNLQDHLFTPVAFFSTKPIQNVLKGSSGHDAVCFSSDGKIEIILSSGVDLMLSLCPFLLTELVYILFISCGLLRAAELFKAHCFSFLFKCNQMLCALFSPLLRLLLRHCFVLLALNTLPTSRGSLDFRKIDPKYLQTDADKQTQIDAVRMAQSFFSKNTRIFEILPSKWISKSPTLLAKYVQYASFSIWHLAGSCKMGRTDLDSVVDCTLKVRGLNGIRICDASILPTLPSGNPNALIMACGSRCVDLILKEYSIE